jgi:hypothetical protein
MLTPRQAKPCKLCEHVMPTAKLCGSPGLRDRRYCYFHMEQHRRAQRIADRKLLAAMHAEVQREERRLRADGITKSPMLKNLILKSFDEATLRDIFGLSSDGEICEIQGKGVATETSS